MSTPFARNTVLFRETYYFCLVCDMYLETGQHASDHIKLPEHTIQLNAGEFVLCNFGNLVRKVNQGFFCEPCYRLLTSEQKLQEHILSYEHTMKRSFDAWTMRDGAVVNEYLGQLDLEWHGIVNRTCTICNIRTNNPEFHVTTPRHFSRLPLLNPEYGIDKGLYRKVGKLFQCLTCQYIFTIPPQTRVTAHFSEAEHLERLLKLKKMGKQVESNQNSDVVDQPAQGTSNEEGTKNEASENACALEVSKVNLKKLKIKTNIMKSFARDLYIVRDSVMGSADIVVNKKIIVSECSFHFITNLECLKCELCEVKLTCDAICAHKISEEHETAMKNVTVIILKSFKNELIREFLPGMYHCGVCNNVVSGLENLLEHLDTTTHGETKNVATLLLQTYRLSLN